MQMKRAENPVRVMAESGQRSKHLSRSKSRPVARNEMSEEAFRAMIETSMEQAESAQTESAEAFFERLDQMF